MSWCLCMSFSNIYLCSADKFCKSKSLLVGVIIDTMGRSILTLVGICLSLLVFLCRSSYFTTFAGIIEVREPVPPAQDEELESI